MIFYNSYVAHKEASFGGRTGKLFPDEKACSRCFKKSRRWAIFDLNPQKVLCIGVDCGCWNWITKMIGFVPDYLRALGMQDEVTEKILPSCHKEPKDADLFSKSKEHSH